MQGSASRTKHAPELRVRVGSRVPLLPGFCSNWAAAASLVPWCGYPRPPAMTPLPPPSLSDARRPCATVCPTPANGTATCSSAGQCGISCSPGYTPCKGQCLFAGVDSQCPDSSAIPPPPPPSPSPPPPPALGTLSTYSTFTIQLSNLNANCELWPLSRAGQLPQERPAPRMLVLLMSPGWRHNF